MALLALLLGEVVGDDLRELRVSLVARLVLLLALGGRHGLDHALLHLLGPYLGELLLEPLGGLGALPEARLEHLLRALLDLLGGLLGDGPPPPILAIDVLVGLAVDLGELLVGVDVRVLSGGDRDLLHARLRLLGLRGHIDALRSCRLLELLEDRRDDRLNVNVGCHYFFFLGVHFFVRMRILASSIFAVRLFVSASDGSMRFAIAWVRVLEGMGTWMCLALLLQSRGMRFDWEAKRRAFTMRCTDGSFFELKGTCVPARGSLKACTTRGGAYGGDPVGRTAQEGRCETV
eukprot:XP_001707474.1 Hypothetical protein GL50803_2632 [Giardia lamblia ATCC 50803]